MSSLDFVAVPFTTDSQFTQLDGVEINATTLLSPGNIFVEIWDVDPFGQPGSPVGSLSGPTDPSGLSSYTGTVNLQPDRSYFIVIGARNGAGSIGTAIFAITGNGVDSQPPPIYRIGTDFDGNGSIDFVNKCLGSAASGSPSWVCGGPIATRFFPEFRILAEEPVPPPNFSLTATPLVVDFGQVAAGSSREESVKIINDGNQAQDLEAISVSSGFTLVNNDCSGKTLQPNEMCDLTIAFSPIQAGTTTGTAIIPTTSDPRSPYSLVLTGSSTQQGAPAPSGPVQVPLRLTSMIVLMLLGIAILRLRRPPRSRRE